VTLRPGQERTSRLSGFARLSPEARQSRLRDAGWLGAAHEGPNGHAELVDPLPFETADRMVENAVGVLGVPVGLGLNFLVDGRDHVVPMAIEEASVVAAASHAALVIRSAGGFRTEATPPWMTAQIHLEGIADLAVAAERVQAHATRLLAAADALQPNMVKRGGGARRVEARICDPFLVVHLILDVGDAMGANALNTVAEGVAPLVEELTGGASVLRILSNLCDERRVRAACRIPVEQLAWHGFPGRRVAEGIAAASRCAEVDPYRAATHNKGIMNGIDAAVVASGNDWRAVEAAAHAWAARGGRYGPLATWRIDGEGKNAALVGGLEMPLALGTVGGYIQAHPGVRAVQRVAGFGGAQELARVVACVGLASNLAALKALATEGIQAGHMSRHARAVAAAAGAGPDEVERVAEAIIAAGEVKVWKAEEILRRLREVR
jgi:hydroxymethylglutaryl-CoA reductase